MDYSQLSDFEINNLVALAIGAKVTDSYRVGDVRESVYYALGEDEFCVRRGYGSISMQFDPCNNASDAWPIIQENFISIIFDEDGNEPPQNAWCKAITKTGESHYGSEKEPLKTAMIAFLMKANKCTFCDGNGFIQIDHGENIGIEHKACPQCEGKCYVHP